MASVSSLDDSKRKKLSRLSDSDEDSNDEEEKKARASRIKQKNLNI